MNMLVCKVEHAERRNTMPNLQCNYNKDKTVTVYLNSRKQFKGPEPKAQRFIKKYYGRAPVTLRKPTYT
jgi:hypothetical protein